MEASNVGSLESLSGGAMKPFELRTIERELRDLWKEKPEEAAQPGKRTTMRACVLNLLIYQEGDEQGSLSETILDITKHHPSRVLVLSTRPNSLHDNIGAEVSAVCHFTPGRGKQICSEQIYIAAEGNAVKRLAATAMPLFVSDLPVVLWWRGVPIDGQPFRGLLSAADRVILDSNYLPRPTIFLSVLAAMAREHFSHVAFSDLNWARLTQLRSHIAGLFDVPDLRNYLRDLNKLLIEYPASEADKELPSPQAMLLLGWLASRLHWNTDPDIFQSKSGAHMFKFKSNEREITVDMVPVDTMKEQDMRLTMTMTDNTGWQEARIIINRAYERNAIETKLETPTICWLKDVARYEMPSESELMVRELEIRSHDTVYENTLERAGHFVENM
ncbi:MAG: glucose-6-phosphate dehydrogenase assembly protein OpcA [Acidobacteriota bacterium]